MKKISVFLRRRGMVLAVCYAAFALAWLALGAAHLAQDAMARASGSLQTSWLTAADFTLVDLDVPEDGLLRTLSSDPQMHLDVSGRTVRNLTVYAVFEGSPREMCLYYTTRPGEDFSQDRRVFAVADGNTYRYTLPHTSISALRLDICSPAENESVDILLEGIELNAPATAASYFLPNWYQCFCFVLYPALAAAFVCLLRQGWDNIKAYKKK